MLFVIFKQQFVEQFHMRQAVFACRSDLARQRYPAGDLIAQFIELLEKSTVLCDRPNKKTLRPHDSEIRTKGKRSVFYLMYLIELLLMRKPLFGFRSHHAR